MSKLCYIKKNNPQKHVIRLTNFVLRKLLSYFGGRVWLFNLKNNVYF